MPKEYIMDYYIVIPAQRSFHFIDIAIFDFANPFAQKKLWSTTTQLIKQLTLFWLSPKKIHLSLEQNLKRYTPARKQGDTSLPQRF
jgi:hypothetical protein